MATEKATATAGEFKMIPLEKIDYNPNNPRKHIDREALKEMAATISKHGVIGPIIARPAPGAKGRFELVVGERRVRASKIADVALMPAIVRDMDDREALELMITENDQRQDPDPLDQAAGYQAWLTLPNEKGELGTREELAAKVGASVSWIHTRIKLLDLVKAGREALQAKYISPGHAILIARLQPFDQLRALAACFEGWAAEPTAMDPATAKFEDIVPKTEIQSYLALLPEKGLRQWIQDHVNLKLKGVPWDLEDAGLVPAAGACVVCLKRSGSNSTLFGDLAVKDADTCFDPECFRGKREALVQLELTKQDDQLRAQKVIASQDPFADADLPDPIRQLSVRHSRAQIKPDQKVLKAGQWIEAKRGSCSSVEKGFLIDGANAGETRHVCCNGKCRTHKHSLDDPTPPPRPRPRVENPEKKKQREEEERRDEQISEAWQQERGKILIGAIDGCPDRAELCLFASLVHDFVTNRLGRNSEKLLQTVKVGKGWNLLTREVVEFLIEYEDDHVALSAFATAAKLDLKKLEKSFRVKMEKELEAKSK